MEQWEARGSKGKSRRVGWCATDGDGQRCAGMGWGWTTDQQQKQLCNVEQLTPSLARCSRGCSGRGRWMKQIRMLQLACSATTEAQLDHGPRLDDSQAGASSLSQQLAGEGSLSLVSSSRVGVS